MMLYDNKTFDNLASESLKAFRYDFCKWIDSHHRDNYIVVFKYIKDEFKNRKILSWDDVIKAPKGSLNEVLRSAKNSIEVMYNSFYWRHRIIFTARDLSILTCIMCLSAVRDVAKEENK